MNLYYVIAEQTVLDKNGKPKLNPDNSPKTETDLRAIPANDLNDLERICSENYVQWKIQTGPFKMNEYWR